MLPKIPSPSSQVYKQQPKLLYDRLLLDALNSLESGKEEECYANLLKLINDPHVKQIHPQVEARAHKILATLHAAQALHHRDEALKRYEELAVANPGDKDAKEMFEKARADLDAAFGVKTLQQRESQLPTLHRVS